MPATRRYREHGDACRAANALDLVGDRWTLIVVRELILGPKRFADLQAAARGITPAVLADRLRGLQEAGIVAQVVLPDLARTRAYVTTEWGRGLEQVLAALGRWFSAGPDPDTSGAMTPDATVLAMRTMAPPGPIDLDPVTLRLHDARLPDPLPREYQVHVSHGCLDIRVGAAPEPAVTVTAECTVWSELLFGGLPLAQAERDGTILINGDRGTADRLVALYPNAPSR